MGLDIFFHKTKPSQNVDVTSVNELSNDLHERFNSLYLNKADKLLKELLNATGIQERTDVINKIRNFTMKMHGKEYEWYYSGITPDKTNDEITKIVDSNKKCAYPHEDVYFRKANFVYAYLQPYLKDECCIITKDMVKILLDKCEKILSIAHKDGWVDKNGKLVDKIGNWKNKYDSDAIGEFTTKLPKKWMDVAEKELPTQSGFFFGSTEYDAWYLYDVNYCVKQFKQLLRNWKEDEVVYNVMSW